MSVLSGKVVVVTQMRKIPKTCNQCKYYDNMGGVSGRYNSGVCAARGTLYSTEHIMSSKQRLENCPLRLIEEELKDD